MVRNKGTQASHLYEKYIITVYSNFYSTKWFSFIGFFFISEMAEGAPALGTDSPSTQDVTKVG